MTPETIAAGWFLVAAFFVVAGVGIVRLGVSEWSERRANRAERRARMVQENNEIVALLQRIGKDIQAEEDDWAEWLGRVPSDGRPLGSVTPLPSKARVLRSVPTQREPGSAS